MLARAFTQSSGIDRERDKLHLSDRCKKGEIACSVQPKPKTKTAQESTDDPTFAFAPWLGPTFHRKESEVLAVQCQLLKMVNSSKLKILIMTVRFETYILWPLLLLQRAKPLTNTYRGIVPTLAREIKALLNVKNGSGKEDRNGAPRKDCRQGCPQIRSQQLVIRQESQQIPCPRIKASIQSSIRYEFPVGNRGTYSINPWFLPLVSNSSKFKIVFHLRKDIERGFGSDCPQTEWSSVALTA